MAGIRAVVVERRMALRLELVALPLLAVEGEVGYQLRLERHLHPVVELAVVVVVPLAYS